MWRHFHRFLLWSPLSLLGGYATALGLLAAAASAGDAHAKEWMSNQFVMLGAIMNAAYLPYWILAIIAVWLAAFIWSTQRLRGEADQKPKPEIQVELEVYGCPDGKNIDFGFVISNIGALDVEITHHKYSVPPNHQSLLARSDSTDLLKKGTKTVIRAMPTSGLTARQHVVLELSYRPRDGRKGTEIREKFVFDIPASPKQALYSPTYRKDRDVDDFDFDPKMIEKALQDRDDCSLIFVLYEQESGHLICSASKRKLIVDFNNRTITFSTIIGHTEKTVSGSLGARKDAIIIGLSWKGEEIVAYIGDTAYKTAHLATLISRKIYV